MEITEQEEADKAAAEHAQELIERQRWEEERAKEQAILKSDPGYQEWLDMLDRQMQKEFNK